MRSPEKPVKGELIAVHPLGGLAWIRDGEGVALVVLGPPGAGVLEGVRLDQTMTSALLDDEAPFVGARGGDLGLGEG